MALGAHSGKIIRMVLSEVSLLAAAGLAAGMVVAIAVSKLVESVRLRNRGSRWSAYLVFRDCYAV
jgi:ABC-type antimicrobial peptide transport system permease subunit